MTSTTQPLTLLSTRRIEAHASGLNYSHNGLCIAYSDNSKETPEVVIIYPYPTEQVRCRPRWSRNLQSPQHSQAMCSTGGLLEIAQIQWSPNDDLIIIYDGNFRAYVHDTKTGEQIGECLTDVAYSHDLSWNKQGDAVCHTGSGQLEQANCVIIRKLLTGEDIIIACGKPNDIYLKADWSPDGNTICTLHRYGKASKSQIKFWKVSL